MTDEYTDAVVGNSLDDGLGASPVVSGLSGASPAVPRDPRLLAAEQAEHDARAAVEKAEEMRRALEEAQAAAAAAQAAADRSKQELETAREEAKAKAKAAALQVRMEQDEIEASAAAALAEQRAARESSLGTVLPVAETAEPETILVTRRTTDGFSGSLALFLLRAVLAVWVGAVGWQALADKDAISGMLSKIGIPSSLSFLGMLGGIGLIVVAVLLLFGAATRVFSAILAVLLVVYLVFFRFGAFSPFIEGHFGFYGDREVFAAIIAVAFVFIGAGGLSVDAVMRKRRDTDEEE